LRGSSTPFALGYRTGGCPPPRRHQGSRPEPAGGRCRVPAVDGARRARHGCGRRL